MTKVEAFAPWVILYMLLFLTQFTLMAKGLSIFLVVIVSFALVRIGAPIIQRHNK